MTKHWNARRLRNRLFVAATLAAGLVLLAAPAWAKWSWK